MFALSAQGTDTVRVVAEQACDNNLYQCAMVQITAIGGMNPEDIRQHILENGFKNTCR